MAADAAPEISYAKSRGLSIAYSVAGEGPLDLVMVPGFVSHLEGALGQPRIARPVGRLASFARVTVFDKPGTGLSDPTDGPATLEERMEDLTAVLDAVGVESAALFGISEGALMCALFAATHPDRTRALVMYGSYAKGIADEDYPWAPQQVQVDLGAEMIEEEWGTGVMLDVYAPSMLHDDEFARWWAQYQRLAASPGMAKAAAMLAAEVDIREVLPAISAPTLVVHRKGDSLWPIEGARFIAEQIPGAELAEIEGIDHFPFAGDAEELISTIEQFLTGAQHAPEPERQLLTVLFTDIVDSTKQGAELGDRRWRELLEGHDEVVREQLDRYRGREVKTTGDGFLATFDGPARGIECARAIAAGVRPLGIEVRAGLHTGECEIRGDDIAGITVNIGARISALAGPGEVLVSGTVKDLVVGSDIDFEPRGSRALKGVPGQWAIFAVPDAARRRPQSPE
jgi:class 3 adenylate cyclase/pimeloyl-ACP methyl ester carboxylesterase